MTTYTCEISGGVGVVPISSCNLRLRDGADSYASITTYFDVDFIDDLSAAMPATMTIYRDLVELATVDIDSIRADIGASRRSISIAGHDAISWGTPPAVTITKINYQTLDNRYRIPVDSTIKPGSVVTTPDGSFTVDYISISANTTNESMEISG